MEENPFYVISCFGKYTKMETLKCA